MDLHFGCAIFTLGREGTGSKGGFDLMGLIANAANPDVESDRW